MVRIFHPQDFANSFGRLALQTSIQRNTLPQQELKNSLIKEVVKKALIELAVSLAFVGVACLLITPPLGIVALLSITVASVAITTLLRSLTAYCHYRLFQLQYSSKEKQEKRELFEKLLEFLEYLAPITFSELVGQHAITPLLYQGGRSLASHAFHSPTILAAAGPAMNVVAAVAAYGTSFALEKSQPELSRYLRVFAINTIVQNVFYALSALWMHPLEGGRDFIHLMGVGIHPLVSIVAIIALPIVIKTGFYIYNKFSKENNE